MSDEPSAERHHPVQQTRDYIQQQKPDVLFLEWNLGNGGNQPPTFTREFFLDYKNVKFVMITGTSLEKQTVDAADLPTNVDMQLAGQNFPALGPIIPDLVALAERMPPPANPSDSDVPGDIPDASVRQKPGAQPDSQAGDLVDEGVGDFASLATSGKADGGGTADQNPEPGTQEDEADFNPLMEEGV